jgi:hypothetical protein
MKPLFSSSFKSGLLALSLVAGLSAPTFAGPMPQIAPSVPAGATVPDVTPVRDSWAGGNDRRIWRHHRNWRGDHWRHRGWRGDGWRHHRHWRHHGWRYRHHYGSGVFLGLGLGIPAYNYYVAPRHYYRGGGSAHVRWCYNRYRSYRAWDNTYQPYNGPRRQCYSPYS